MGFNLNRFRGDVDPNLACAICGGVLQDAVLTPCGHTFCSLCLDTWLARPGGSSTCPECRGRVNQQNIRPIHSVRNLINNLEISCDHSTRGCREVVRVESLGTHRSSCKFLPIECAGCGVVVSRSDLADHQINCEAIAAAIRDEELSCPTKTTHSKSSLTYRPRCAQRRTFDCCSVGSNFTSAAVPSGHLATSGHLAFSSDLYMPRSLPCEVTDLACRIATLEIQLKRMKHDLESADRKNRKLERDLDQAKKEVEANRVSTLDLQSAEFDPSYDYGFEPSSITKLSQLLCKFLFKPPCYIDRDRIFVAVRRCYDNFVREGDECERAVHMLVSTAYASNWFNETQRLNLYLWLQSMMRGRQFSPGSQEEEKT